MATLKVTNIKNESFAGDQLYLKSDGKIGIGTTSPTNALDVQAGTTNTAIVARSTDAKAQISLLDNATTSVGCVVLGAEGDELFLTSGSSGSEALRIDSSGQLIVGQTSAYAATGTGNMMLTIAKSATNRTDIAISNQSSGNNASAAVVLATHGQDYILEATGSGNTTDGASAFRILKSSTERLCIKSDGETNIGTGAVNIAKFCQSGNKHQIVGQAAANVAALDVYSQHGNDGDRLSFAVSDNRTGSKSNAFAIRGDGNVLIDTTGNGYGGLKIYDDSGGDYNVRYVAGRNQSATSHVFMRSGRTQNQSPWADATPVEHARIARGGIAFGGDTAAVNTLDDYEEGTYTPVITCATSGGYNLNSSYYTMAYRKIGSLVHIQGYISVVSESGTPNGTLRITLPKTATALTQNADYTGIKILVRNHGSSNIYNQVAVTHGDGAYFNILFDDGNGASTYMTHAHVDTEWQFFISGGYIAD